MHGPSGGSGRVARCRALTALAVFAALLGSTRDVRADVVGDYFLAHDQFALGEFENAAGRFSALLGPDTTLPEPFLELARSDYVASLVALGRVRDATAVVEQILRANPDARFDPNYHSGAVVGLLHDVRARMAEELDRIRSARRATSAATAARRVEQRERLNELLTNERLVVRYPRWPTFAPFGVGQFANGDVGLGFLFLSGGTLSLGAAIGSALYGTNRSLCAVQSCGTPVVVVNTAAWAVFAGFAIAGVIQANRAYVPERVELRRRPIPPGLRDLQLAVNPPVAGSPLSVELGLRF